MERSEIWMEFTDAKCRYMQKRSLRRDHLKMDREKSEYR